MSAPCPQVIEVVLQMELDTGIDEYEELVRSDVVWTLTRLGTLVDCARVVPEGEKHRSGVLYDAAMDVRRAERP